MSITEEETAPDPSSEISITNKVEPQYDCDCSRIDLLSKFIRQDLDLMSSKNVPSQIVKQEFDKLVVQIEEARTVLEAVIASSSAEVEVEVEGKLLLLKKKVRLLKSKFPFNVLTKPTNNPLDSNVNTRDRSTPHSLSSAPDKLMKNLETYECFKRTPPQPQDVKESFREMNHESRICLFCFLVLPKNSIIKRSILFNWAKVHDIVFVNDPIHHLVENDLIHIVYKDTLTVGGYWMHPSVRSTLIDQNLLNHSRLEAWMFVPPEEDDADIIYDDPEQFSFTGGGGELRILHLGNWQRLSVRHIEFEKPDLFFHNWAQLHKVRYFSLRGVSLITNLPKFITQLDNLEILDLKACYNLEAIPSDIDNLWNCLTHLDISECYFLESMPMALSMLCKLQVLKGFVVDQDGRKNSGPCTLQDLLSLTDLMKLNIYTSLKGFPDDDQLSTLKKFRFLQSLTISWAGWRTPIKYGQPQEPSTTNERKIPQRNFTRRDSSTVLENKEISFNLEKLDLRGVPEKVMPLWLKPSNFKHLEKLYIRGGQLCDLGQRKGEHTEEERKWNVEILRLKHLENLVINYSDLEGLFPNFICLEKVKCPKVQGFPSDGITVRKDASFP